MLRDTWETMKCGQYFMCFYDCFYLVFKGALNVHGVCHTLHHSLFLHSLDSSVWFSCQEFVSMTSQFHSHVGNCGPKGTLPCFRSCGGRLISGTQMFPSSFLRLRLIPLVTSYKEGEVENVCLHLLACCFLLPLAIRGAWSCWYLPYRHIPASSDHACILNEQKESNVKAMISGAGASQWDR